jgi:hypothetical protein
MCWVGVLGRCVVVGTAGMVGVLDWLQCFLWCEKHEGALCLKLDVFGCGAIFLKYLRPIETKSDHKLRKLAVMTSHQVQWVMFPCHAFDWGGDDSEEILLKCNANKSNIYPLTTGGDYIDRTGHSFCIQLLYSGLWPRESSSQIYGFNAS